MSVGMIYIKTRKEHPFLSALETNYLQKQEALKVGFEPTKIVLQTIEYTIPPQRYLLYASL